jgi:hypothetical protein
MHAFCFRLSGFPVLYTSNGDLGGVGDRLTAIIVWYYSLLSLFHWKLQSNSNGQGLLEYYDRVRIPSESRSEERTSAWEAPVLT